MKPTQEQIIAWAREVTADDAPVWYSAEAANAWASGYNAGRKDENEACAKVCDAYIGADPIAAAIRARREQ